MDAFGDQLFGVTVPDGIADMLQLLGHLARQHLEVAGAEHARGRPDIGRILQRRGLPGFVDRAQGRQRVGLGRR